MMSALARHTSVASPSVSHVVRGVSANEDANTLDRRAQIAADVAARYGCSVSPNMVKIVPLGSSAYHIVWDGTELRYADASGHALASKDRRKLFNASTKQRRTRPPVDPAVAERRNTLVGLVSEGMTDDQIAARLDIDVQLVRVDRNLLGIKGNAAVMLLSDMVPHLGKAKELLDRGFAMQQIDLHMGWRKGSMKTLLAREKRQSAQNRSSKVAERRARIFDLLGKGKKPKEVAADLGVSVETVHSAIRKRRKLAENNSL